MYTPIGDEHLDESTFQEGMARLIRMTHQNGHSGPSARESPEKVGDFHICKMCNHVWKIRKSNPNPKSCPSCHSTIWNSPNARKIRCARCGHEWITNLKHPAICPNCRSRTYDLPTLMVRCKICGRRWEDAMNQSDATCPNCGKIPRDSVKILPRIEDMVANDKVEPRKKPLSISREDVDSLSKQPDDYSRFVYLNKIGLGPTEADILIRYMNEQKPVDIALELDIPLGIVFETIVPYIDAAGTEVN